MAFISLLLTLEYNGVGEESGSWIGANFEGRIAPPLVLHPGCFTYPWVCCAWYSCSLWKCSTSFGRLFYHGGWPDLGLPDVAMVKLSSHRWIAQVPLNAITLYTGRFAVHFILWILWHSWFHKCSASKESVSMPYLTLPDFPVPWIFGIFPNISTLSIVTGIMIIMFLKY